MKILSHQFKPVKGMTMVELFIVIAIAALLVTLGIPGFRSMIANNQASTLVNDFNAALRMARIQSIRLNTTVYVCAINTAGTGCDYTLNAWPRGWRVQTAGNVLIQTFDDISTGTAVSVQAGTDGAYRIGFLPPSGIWHNTTSKIATIAPANSNCYAQRIFTLQASGTYYASTPLATSGCTPP